MTRRRTLTGSPAVPLAEAHGRLGTTADASRREAMRRHPARLTRYYLDLVDPADPADPIRRIAWPDAAELETGPGDLDDPVGERLVNPVPFVVRKHGDRALLLVTARCHVYCRFCFRRSFPDGEHRDPSPRALDRALSWLAGERGLREVILSGGDPLVLPDEALAELVARLSAIPHLTRLRVHTRAPVHDPARVTPALVEALSLGLPMRVVLHFNHPREITAETRRVAALFRDAGIPLLNQSVLLAGVNDDEATLERLSRALVREGIRPYYLHHPDRVAGSRAFWVEIERGLALYGGLARRLAGGVGLPRYVIDLPDGTGKVPVASLATHLFGPRPRWDSGRA